MSQMTTFVSPTKTHCPNQRRLMRSSTRFSMNSPQGSRWSPIRTQKAKSRIRSGSSGSNLYVSWDQPLCLKIQPLCLPPAHSPNRRRLMRSSTRFSMNSPQGSRWSPIRTQKAKSRIRSGSSGSNLYVSWDQPLCLKIQPLCLPPKA